MFSVANKVMTTVPSLVRAMCLTPGRDNISRWICSHTCFKFYHNVSIFYRGSISNKHDNVLFKFTRVEIVYYTFLCRLVLSIKWRTFLKRERWALKWRCLFFFLAFSNAATVVALHLSFYQKWKSELILIFMKTSELLPVINWRWAFINRAKSVSD